MLMLELLYLVPCEAFMAFMQVYVSGFHLSK